MFLGAAQRLSQLADADAGKSMEAALICYGQSLSVSCLCCLRELGQILGAYGLDEQTGMLEALCCRVKDMQTELRQGRRELCRSYEVMGVCAGSALAILLF